MKEAGSSLSGDPGLTVFYTRKRSKRLDGSREMKGKSTHRRVRLPRLTSAQGPLTHACPLGRQGLFFWSQ